MSDRSITAITRRLSKLEKRMNIVAVVVSRMAGWFGRKRRNNWSQSLSGPEVAAFRARMEAHGLDDDDTRNERREKATVRL